MPIANFIELKSLYIYIYMYKYAYLSLHIKLLSFQGRIDSLLFHPAAENVIILKVS